MGGDAGEEIFPELGVQFVPQRGCAVMWSCQRHDGAEECRVVHRAVALTDTVRYAAMCFFRNTIVRPSDGLVTIDPGELAAKYGTGRVLDESGQETFRKLRVHQ